MDESGERQSVTDHEDEARVRYGAWWWGGRGGFPWLGAMLIGVGVALAASQADPRIETSHALAFFVGLVLWAAFLTWWAGGWAGLPAALLSGWGLARSLDDLGYVSGPGWTALLVGAGSLGVYLAGVTRGGRHHWALWVGLVLVAVGALQVAAPEIPGLPPLDALVVPLLLIAVGIALVVRAFRRAA